MSKVVKVNIEPVASTDNIFEYVFARCNFCQKESGMLESSYKNIVKLGHGYYYCPFCTRNRFNYKKREHILLMDFRGIIGFYINYLYHEGSIYNSQIIDYIRKHSIVGLKNPVFFYDHESMLWFIDFTRIGQDKHKFSIDTVNETIKDIINAFDIDKNLKSCNSFKMIEKYNQAIEEFYKTRKRPEGKRILSPTLKNCAYRAKIDWDQTKRFSINIDSMNFIPVGSNAKIQQYTEDLTEPAIEELNVNIKERKSKGNVIGWECYAEIAGISRSKLSATDGTTIFKDRKSLILLAKKTAKKLGLKLSIPPEKKRSNA